MSPSLMRVRRIYRIVNPNIAKRWPEGWVAWMPDIIPLGYMLSYSNFGTSGSCHQFPPIVEPRCRPGWAPHGEPL